ncbi:alpha/beta hydrolase [Ramlibacter sp. WS9]|uniref:alpha/beta hydrolase n=1 Tax=Ramlibacter sp. WS9 TaxID=1882741 RepID=UPI0011433985|nr:alpha/beta hydrolase [Ramlibacter sp. WS9]ROZ78295.1 alpha/beta hydrolase [Ramlibacter sp. WS9]
MNAALRNLLAAALLAWVSCAWAADVPQHAQGLDERLVSVELAPGVRQEGVLSQKDGATAPTHLAVLLPGNPSVVRPQVEGRSMVASRLTGNFLIRARRHLAGTGVATLVVDCRTDQGDLCSGEYQASRQRHEDVARLIAAARAQLPSIKHVWLVGTSLGTISSAFMPTHASAGEFAGVLHTAAITDPYRGQNARSLVRFDYRRVGIAQAFVHHMDDPCVATPYQRAESIAREAGVTLVSVTGAKGVRGDPCQAQTQHGFVGVERAVMTELRRMMTEGVGSSRTLAVEPD